MRLGCWLERTVRAIRERSRQIHVGGLWGDLLTRMRLGFWSGKLSTQFSSSFLLTCFMLFTLLVTCIVCVENQTSGGTSSAESVKEHSCQRLLSFCRLHTSIREWFPSCIHNLKCSYQTRSLPVKNSVMLTLRSTRREPHSPHPMVTPPALLPHS